MSEEEKAEIKRKIKLAAIEVELERRYPGFTGPVKLKSVHEESNAKS